MRCRAFGLSAASLNIKFIRLALYLQEDWSSITKSRGKSDPNTQLGVRLVAGKLMLCKPHNKLESHRLVRMLHDLVTYDSADPC
jgi:hypothetical protein